MKSLDCKYGWGGDKQVYLRWKMKLFHNVPGSYGLGCGEKKCYISLLKHQYPTKYFTQKEFALYKYVVAYTGLLVGKSLWLR